MKITSIERVPFKGKVYNLELKSNRTEDDLFWLEGKTGVITHNCFPKDMEALRFFASKTNVKLPVISAAITTNNDVRQNRDWEEQKGRAVINTETL